MTIGKPLERVGVIVESELDAILLAQQSNRPLYIVALGHAQAKPSDMLLRQLSLCPVVLVSLDSDDAGAQASWKNWIGLPGVFRSPPIGGKDLTDMWSAGVDLNNWISVSLELYCREILGR